MTKAELKNIMSDNCMIECEVDDAIQFVQDLLEFQANEIELSEPYAVNCVNRLRSAAREVWNLQGYVEDVMEQEEA